MFNFNQIKRIIKVKTRNVDLRKCFLVVLVVIVFTVYILVNDIIENVNSDGDRDSVRDNEKVILSALGSRNTSEFVKPLENTILIDVIPNRRQSTVGFKSQHEVGEAVPSALTSSEDRHPSPFILIVVLSEIGHEEERQAIRQTWYNWMADEDVRILFFLGLPSADFDLTSVMAQVQDESQLYNDIILDDLIESYYLLAVKVVRILKWFTSTYKKPHQKRPSFLVKTDHDVFVNVPKLVAELKGQGDKPHYVGGFIHEGAKPYRDSSAKWFTPKSVYSLNRFPNYASGPFYCMAGGVVPLIYEASLLEPLFHLEDIFITGFVANNRLGIELHDLDTKGKSWLDEVYYYLFGWDRSSIFYHGADPVLMKTLYHQIISSAAS